MSDQQRILGAYSAYTCEIDAPAKQAFEEALKDLLGVTYTPVAVSQQVVAGTNYRFFCNTESATRFPIMGSAIVSIYKPLEGSAHITGIQIINN